MVKSLIFCRVVRGGSVKVHDFKDPMCFPFSNSGYMPATKMKSLHSTAGSENI